MANPNKTLLYTLLTVAGEVYRFGAYEVNPSEREIRKAGHRLTLPPQPFRVLEILLGNSGHLVTRESLSKALWPEGTYVDAERGLNTAIKRIRDLLCDNSAQPRFLETVPRTGYRFIAPVDVQEVPVRRSANTGLAALAPSDPSVAVLDFENATRDPAWDWLSGGIAETLTGKLKRVNSLRVLDRQRVAAESRRGPGSAAFGTRWLLRGRFAMVAGELHITALLHESAGGASVSEALAYGSFDGLFGLLDRIVRDLSSALQVSSAIPAQAPETVQLNAFHWYAKGRQRFNQFTPQSLSEAETMFRQAIAVDPNYALAWAGVGSVYIFRFIRTTEIADLDTGVQMLAHAIELDPELAFPYVWLTYANFRRQKFEEAIEAGCRAVDLEPLNYQAHYFLATGYIGRAVMEHKIDSFPFAETALRACIDLEGNYQPARMILAWLLAIRGDYQEAESQARLAAEIEASRNFEATNFIGGFSLLGNILFRSGRLDEAEQAQIRSLELMTPRSHLYKEQFTAISYCCLGDIALARRRADDGLGHFKTALEHIASNPKGLGIGHCIVRAHAGMARAFHKLGMSREARQEFDFALSTLTNRTGYDFSWMWEGSDAESWCELARAAAVMSRPTDALTHLRKAARCGWCDRVAAQQDECLSRLSGQEGFAKLFQPLPHP